MKRIITILTAVVAGALLALVAIQFAPSTFAQGPNTPPQSMTQRGRGPMMDRGSQQGGAAESLVGMAAAQLNLTQAELVAQLGDEGTILTALTTAGIDPQDFIDQFVASRAARLDAAVAAGTMTRVDADAHLNLVRSQVATRIAQPLSADGPQGRGQGMQHGTHGGDADGDGVCDQMPQAGQGHQGGRGPRR